MTEQEALTKWCPFVRIVSGKVDRDGQSQHVGTQPAFNRIVDGDNGNWAFPKPGGCIGSACMAWRRRRWFWWPPMTIGEQWRRKKIGHCGLAGKP